LRFRLPLGSHQRDQTLDGSLVGDRRAPNFITA
jgi:hypothetical protein